MNIIRTLVLAASLTFTLCLAGQVRPDDPQLSADPADFPAYPLKASDNRIPPVGQQLTTHSFALPTGCGSANVRAHPRLE
jgi:hypothetical protein